MYQNYMWELLLKISANSNINANICKPLPYMYKTISRTLSNEAATYTCTSYINWQNEFLPKHSVNYTAESQRAKLFACDKFSVSV